MRSVAVRLGVVAALVVGLALVPHGSRSGVASAATVCASGPGPTGVDVSVFAGSIDWTQVAHAGYSFGYARAAVGTTPDMTFQANYAGMKAAGLTPGAYLYFDPALNPTDQANALLAALTQAHFAAGDLLPAIDLETTDGQSAGTVIANLQTAVTTVQQALGSVPVIYTLASLWHSIGDPAQFAAEPLWVANWGVACPNVPTGWSTWALWQYSSSGTVPGIAGPVDLDQANGSVLPTYTGAQSTALSLLPGWNLISLPLQPTSTLNAATLVNVLLQNNASSTLVALFQLTGNVWSPPVIAQPGHPATGGFPLAVGTGYLLYSDVPNSYSEQGTVPASGPSWQVTQGWNLVGLSAASSAGLQSNTVLAAVQHSGSGGQLAALFGLSAGAWRPSQIDNAGSFIPSAPFTLQTGQGYLLYSDHAAAVTPGLARGAPRERPPAPGAATGGMALPVLPPLR